MVIMKIIMLHVIMLINKQKLSPYLREILSSASSESVKSIVGIDHKYAHKYCIKHSYILTVARNFESTCGKFNVL